MPGNDDFLKEFFADCQKGMRHRVESEYKLLQMFIIIDLAIITAVSSINELVSDKEMLLLLTYSIVTFLTTITLLFTWKIIAGHKVYEQIGQQVVRVWKHFGLFKKGAYITGDTILNKEAENYGKGKGYLRTLVMLWLMTIMTDSMLLIISKYVA